jgi:transposase
MAKPDDLSKPAVALDHDSTLVCVIEMSGTSWLVAATVPGVDRRRLTLKAPYKFGGAVVGRV